MSDVNVISLSDRVKNQVYDDYQRLKRQHTKVLQAKSSYGKHFALNLFRTKYIEFIDDVMCIDMYERIKKEVKNRAQYYRNNVNMIKSNKDMDEIMFLSIALIRGLKITTISFMNNEDAF